jgi:hypothetical protein
MRQQSPLACDRSRQTNKRRQKAWSQAKQLNRVIKRKAAREDRMYKEKS